jgi:heme exporter protein A
VSQGRAGAIVPAAVAPAVAVRGLHRSFGGRPALQGLDLTVRRGEFLTIFGPNGAGKSTLIKILSRLVRPNRGEVSVLGEDLSTDAGASIPSRIGLMGHLPFLYTGLTGLENLVFFARMYGVEEPEARARELLKDLDLADRGDDLVRGYSRGMLQRLSAARALVQDPDLLLLDEPYTGLDPSASDLLSALLGRMHSRGRTVMLTSHDLALGRRLCTRFLILAQGRVILEATPEEVSEPELEELYRRQVGEG